MIDLQTFFDGLFLDTKITHPRLVLFAFDNVANMTNNNPGGIYTDAIEATNAAAENLDSICAQKAGTKGTRKGGTTAKDLARRDAEIYIANHTGWARALFGGKNDPRYVATFPQGMKAFYNVPDPVFDDNLKALIEKANTYKAILGDAFETDLTLLLNNFKTAGETHTTQTADVRTIIVTEQMAADVLSDQLTDNLLLIARNNRRSKTAAKLYFNVDLLYPHKLKEIKKGTPAANSETEICPIEYTEDKRTHILNNGAARLTFGMKLNGLKVGKTIALDPGQKANEPFSFYFSNGTSLYVVNNENIEGMFRLEIIL